MDPFNEAMFAKMEREEWRERLGKVFVGLGQAASDLRRAIEGAEDLEELRNDVAAVRGALVELLRLEDAELFGSKGEAVDLTRHTITQTADIETDGRTIVEVELEGVAWEGEILQQAKVVSSRSRRPTGKEDSHAP